MAKQKGRPENLIPNSQRTPEERRENARKAGKASVEARREKKRLSTIYGEMLAGKYEVTINGEKQKLDGAELVRFIMRDVLMRRDSASVSLLKEIREGTEGSKVQLDANVNMRKYDYSKLTDAQLEELEKLTKKIDVTDTDA